MQDAGSPRCTEGVSISAMKLTLRSNLLDVLVLQDDGAAGRSRNIDGDLVKSRELFFGALAVGDIEETRNVLEVLTTLSLDDRILATSNRGEVALESTNMLTRTSRSFHVTARYTEGIPFHAKVRNDFMSIRSLSRSRLYLLISLSPSKLEKVIRDTTGDSRYNGVSKMTH